MPVYNAGRYLAEAIESVLGQTFTDLELIIIDDGSTDRSLEMARRYAAADPRIRVRSRENRGVFATRNEGLAMATGRYLANMDADDVSLPDRLAKQVAYLDEHPECLLVTSRLQLIDTRGDPIRTINLEASHEEIDGANMAFDRFYVGDAFMARRDALLAVGGYREQFVIGADRDLQLRLAERGRLASIPEVLYLYRQHPHSVCRSRPSDLTRCIKAIVVEARRRRGLDPLEDPPETAASEVDGSRLPLVELHRIWAWWALSEGHVATARKHAAVGFAQRPLSVYSWRLLYCTLRGH